MPFFFKVWGSTISVSYTHLDVYKRQPQGNSSVTARKRTRRQMEAEVSNILNYGLTKEKVNNTAVVKINIHTI